jgi:hypothetical protein
MENNRGIVLSWKINVAQFEIHTAGSISSADKLEASLLSLLCVFDFLGLGVRRVLSEIA